MMFIIPLRTYFLVGVVLNFGVASQRQRQLLLATAAMLTKRNQVFECTGKKVDQLLKGFFLNAYIDFKKYYHA